MRNSIERAANTIILGARHPRIAEIGMQKIIYNILLRIAKEYYMHDFGDRAKIQQCK
jgi:hypothetical protein